MRLLLCIRYDRTATAKIRGLLNRTTGYSAAPEAAYPLNHLSNHGGERVPVLNQAAARLAERAGLGEGVPSVRPN